MNNQEFTRQFMRNTGRAMQLRGASKCDLRCAWGDALEAAHRNGEITDRQVNTWTCLKEWQPAR